MISNNAFSLHLSHFSKLLDAAAGRIASGEEWKR
jgi:hypothetical protein